MASFTCTHADGEEEVGDRGGEHGDGETSSGNNRPQDRHCSASVLVDKAARDRTWLGNMLTVPRERFRFIPDPRVMPTRMEGIREA